MKISIIGLGWFGLPLAQSLVSAYKVCGSKSSMQGVEHAQSQGIDARLLLLNPDWRATDVDTEALLDAEVLVLNVPPGLRSGASPDHYRKQMESVGTVFAKNNMLRHVVFVSSTGVFGDHQGRVNEESKPEPNSDSGKLMLEVEQLMLSTFSNKCSILRPAGLAGEKRHPGRFLAGRKGLQGRLHPVNLVHRDDLVRMCQAIVARPGEPGVYHAVARLHPSKEAYYKASAIALGLEPPIFDASDTSKGKLVDAERSKEILGIRFSYDDPYDMV
jgi:nucleoside-diphosphate-sugar epimerase